MALIRARFVEATAGFEPAHRGFADLYPTPSVAHMVRDDTPEHRCSAEWTAA